jgi:hypothetical protein
MLVEQRLRLCAKLLTASELCARTVGRPLRRSFLNATFFLMLRFLNGCYQLVYAMVYATVPPRRDATVDGCCPHPWKRSVRSYGRQTCVLCECVTHRVRLWYVCTLGRDSALANGVRPRLGLCARALPVAYMSMSMYMYYS